MEERSTTLIGTVRSVIYQNEENGYAVMRVTTDDGKTETLVGYLPFVAAGEELVANGHYTTHPQHGEQFQVEEAERRLPLRPDEIVRFLASGTIRGVGPATAQKLVDTFGEKTFEALAEGEAQLTKVKGLTARRAREISESFREQMGLRRLTEFLSRYKLPVALSLALYRRFGMDAVERVCEDPYLLCSAELGVDFSTVDEMALALDFPPDCAQRTEAAVLFELFYNENNGHVFLPRGKLIDAAARLLDMPGETVEAALDALLTRGAVVQQQVANVQACYLYARYQEECETAQRLLELRARAPEPLRGAKNAIDEIERVQGLRYAPQQRHAVELAAQESVLILTGGPGTGKTTCVRGIVTLYERMGLDVALAAPTGRAAKRLGELCAREGQTLHRLLGVSWNDATGELTLAKNAREPLEADAVIVDETSMLDLSITRALLAALKPGCRLLLVGDADQLPSVGAGCVFRDLIRSERFPVVALTEIFRQAEASGIVRNAHAVNEGRTPELKNSVSGDFFFMPRRDSARLCDTVVELCRTRLPDKMGIPAADIQVLTPTRRGATGTLALNSALQAALNPPAPNRNEHAFGDTVFREGDRVMQIRNDYELIWQREDGVAGTGVFNGDVGRILQIDNAAGLMAVAYDERVATYPFEQLGELELAYAVTVHKSQGSEYRAVVFVSAPAAPGLMVRGVLYTAITRARELLVIVGDDAVLSRMAANAAQQRRYSGLRWRLAEGAQ